MKAHTGLVSTGCSLLVAGCLLLVSITPAGAQDPVGGALATLSAATAQTQARQWQAAQVATRQAIDIQATQQAQVAQSTRQAVDSQLTRQAIDTQATRTAIDVQATGQAVSAQATAQAQAVQAQETRQAIDAQATRQAYDLAYQQGQERMRVGLWLLYAVAAVCLAGCVYVVIVWARKTARKVAPPAPVGPSVGANGVAVDVMPVTQLMLAGPSDRMGGGFTVVNDPQVVQAFRQYVDKNAIQRSEPCQQR